MIRKRLITLVSAVLMSLGVVAVVASPAQASDFEVNYAVDVSWSDAHDKDCASYDYMSACFQPYGDIIWVKDNLKDGRSVWVTWKEWGTGRTGGCYDQLGVDAGWTWCNKDLSEGHDIDLTLHYWTPGGEQVTKVLWSTA